MLFGVTPEFSDFRSVTQTVPSFDHVTLAPVCDIISVSEPPPEGATEKYTVLLQLESEGQRTNNI